MQPNAKHQAPSDFGSACCSLCKLTLDITCSASPGFRLPHRARGSCQAQLVTALACRMTARLSIKAVASGLRPPSSCTPCTPNVRVEVHICTHASHSLCMDTMTQNRPLQPLQVEAALRVVTSRAALRGAPWAPIQNHYISQKAHPICGLVCSAFLQGGDQVQRCITGLPQSSQGFSRIPECSPAQILWHILRLL